MLGVCFLMFYILVLQNQTSNVRGFHDLLAAPAPRSAFLTAFQTTQTIFRHPWQRPSADWRSYLWPWNRADDGTDSLEPIGYEIGLRVTFLRFTPISRRLRLKKLNNHPTYTSHGGFLKWRLGFSIVNHPAIGVPPCMETSTCLYVSRWGYSTYNLPT